MKNYQKHEKDKEFISALKFKKSATYITKDMKDDAKKMLELLGIPVIQAPGEAEAQCSALVKSGYAYATATEDMDALTFGMSYLTSNRHLQGLIW